MCSPLSSKTHTSVYALTVQSLVNLRWAAWKKQQEELASMQHGSISKEQLPEMEAHLEEFIQAAQADGTLVTTHLNSKP